MTESHATGFSSEGIWEKSAIRAADDERIEYRLEDDAWQGFDSFITSLIVRGQARTVCEIGGGANPALPIEFVQAHGLDYVIMDISAPELRKAPSGYRTRVQDVTAPLTGEEGTYDLVFSKMLAEHIKDPVMFHGNLHRLLKPGGVSCHFFPTFFAAPYVVNRLLPERLTAAVVNLLQSGRERSGRHAKFPAYYRWCRGPIPSQFRRFETMGFHVRQYIGFFGYPGYFKKLPMIERAHRARAAWRQQHPNPWLTSFAYIVLEKSVESTAVPRG